MHITFLIVVISLTSKLIPHTNFGLCYNGSSFVFEQVWGNAISYQMRSSPSYKHASSTDQPGLQGTVNPIL